MIKVKGIVINTCLALAFHKYHLYGGLCFLIHIKNIINKYYIVVMYVMNNIKNITLGITIIIAIAITNNTFTNFNDASVFAQNDDKFMANLTGKEEVPPTNSSATGTVELTLKGNDGVDYKVNVTNIRGVTDGHLHLGQKGENGLIVFTLFRPDAPVDQISENETISADEFVGPLKGKSISDLTTAMGNGSIYANIHTQENPNGDIRGQIMGTQ
jgi:hypothetical protein